MASMACSEIAATPKISMLAAPPVSATFKLKGVFWFRRNLNISAISDAERITINNVCTDCLSVYVVKINSISIKHGRTKNLSER
jgi:hypothetical protein